MEDTMKRKRFTEEQIIGVLKEAAALLVSGPRRASRRSEGPSPRL